MGGWREADFRSTSALLTLSPTGIGWNGPLFDWRNDQVPDATEGVLEMAAPAKG